MVEDLSLPSKEFEIALKRAAEIVASWPEWKQTSWLVSRMAKTPEKEDTWQAKQK
jgi:hypothetical protein